MITQDVYLPQVDWDVRTFYCPSPEDTEEIFEELFRMKCPEYSLRRAWSLLRSGEKNTGLTYSNPYMHRSVMVIGRGTDFAEFLNTWSHEKTHLCMAIINAYDIDPYSEEAAYMSGEITKLFYRSTLSLIYKIAASIRRMALT